MEEQKIFSPTGETISNLKRMPVGDAISELTDDLGHYFGSLSRIRSNPLPAAAAAAGVGLLLGSRKWLLPLIVGAGIGMMMHDRSRQISRQLS